MLCTVVFLGFVRLEIMINNLFFFQNIHVNNACVMVALLKTLFLSKGLIAQNEQGPGPSWCGGVNK